MGWGSRMPAIKSLGRLRIAVMRGAVREKNKLLSTGENSQRGRYFTTFH